jgi:hypothetical protein
VHSRPELLSYSNGNNRLGLPRALEVSGHQLCLGTQSTVQTGDGDGCPDMVEAHGNSRYGYTEVTWAVGQEILEEKTQ